MGFYKKQKWVHKKTTRKITEFMELSNLNGLYNYLHLLHTPVIAITSLAFNKQILLKTYCSKNYPHNKTPKPHRHYQIKMEKFTIPQNSIGSMQWKVTNCYWLGKYHDLQMQGIGWVNRIDVIGWVKGGYIREIDLIWCG